MRNLILLALVAVLGATPSAFAQTCGDANGDDNVSVTDGVQALRAAADLPSTCSEGCDVDGSGGVSVIDGVNILRRVAGLSSIDACQFTGEEANEVVEPAFGVFDALHKLPGIGMGAMIAGTPVCENDGTLNTEQNDGTSFAAFQNCQIGGVIIDGALSRANFANATVVGFDDLSITSIKTGKSLTFTGQLTVGSSLVGPVLTGKLSIVSDDLGSIAINFTRVAFFPEDGSPRGGELLIDLSEANGGTVESIQIFFSVEDEFDARLRLRTGQIKLFVLNRTTRLLRLPL